MTRFDDEWAQTRTTRTRAELRRRGVGRKALRGARYERIARGYYRSAGNGDAKPSPTQRIRDAGALLPPGALITGWAAAYVHGVALLDGLDDRTLHPLPVPVLLPPGLRRVSTAAIHYRQSSRPYRGEVIEGLPVTFPLRTALDLARHAPDLTEAVVGLDAFLGARVIKLEQLRRGVARTAGQRGARQLRAAVAATRIGVKSSWETRLRLFAAGAVGLTRLEPNRAVFDRAGNLLGVPDLLDAESALVLEYDGATWRTARAQGHRDREQHREDNAREERLERAGLIVVRVEKRDLTDHPAQLAKRIAGAYRDGLDRDRTRDRWTLDEPDDWFGLPG